MKVDQSSWVYRDMDSGFPKWSAVCYYFNQWTANGVLEQTNLALNMLERIEQGREATPSLGLADLQSVRSAPRINEQRGTDGNKQVNGRKRHVLVDVLGRIWKSQVHVTNIHDSPGGVGLLEDRKKII